MVQIAQSAGIQIAGTQGTAAEHSAIECVPFEVERGPEILIVRLGAPAAGISDWAGLADRLWAVLQQHFTYRLVLDCERAGLVDSMLIGQLVLLERRIRKQGGLIRLCALSPASRQALRQCRLDGRFPHFETPADAILGHRPSQPR